jgi:hypothetical protein
MTGIGQAIGGQTAKSAGRTGNQNDLVKSWCEKMAVARQTMPPLARKT